MEVLEAERQHHLRASVYSSDPIARERSNGIVMWIDGVLLGELKDQYTGQANMLIEEIQEANSKTKKIEPGGTEWMAEDGL